MLDALHTLDPVYVAGVAETPLGKVVDHTELSMLALAAEEALAEAGLRIRDVDAVFVNYMGEEGSVQVGEYLGIEARYADSTDLGGGSFEAFIHKAMVAVATGQCEVALIGYASRQRSRRNRKRAVAASEVFVTPFHRHDICLRVDGGGAAVVTTRARARDAAKTPIRVLGAAHGHTHWHVSQLADFTRSSGVRSGRDAFARAGIGHADVDVLELYDNFTSSVILQLEDLGFCKRGEGGPFVAEGHLRPGGRLPALTMGGGLSYNHPGALGILLLVEAVRQLRGECGERQVAGAEVGVVHGIGGISNSAAATVVLGRE